MTEYTKRCPNCKRKYNSMNRSHNPIDSGVCDVF